MRKLLAVSLGAALVLGLSGCADGWLTAPGGPTLEFDVRDAEHGQWLEEPVLEVTSLAGAVSIDARLSTPDPCRRFQAAAHRNGTELLLEVVVRPTGQPCYAIVGTFEYTAVLQGLEPGAYRLLVVHQYPDTGAPQPKTVLDTTVLVQ